MLHRRAPGLVASVTGQALDRPVPGTELVPDVIFIFASIPKQWAKIGVELHHIEDDAVITPAQIPASVDFLKRKCF
jgi:hypothetical protein